MNKTTELEAQPAGWIDSPALLLVSLALATLTACAATQATPNAFSDSDITSGVQTALAAEPSLGAYTINVSTVSGRVHLSGVVATEGDRDRAQRIAAASTGVVSIDNYIRFDPALVE